jgi:LytTr DNA-binding domain
MNARLTANSHSPQHRVLVVLSIALTTCITLTVLLDIIESTIQHSAFYFSESFLFSSVWWLFLPLLYGQFFIADLHNTKSSYTLFVLLPIVTHLFAYPAVVWLISKLFYYHTFSYWQTFQYALTEYVFILLAAYSVPFILYRSFKNKLLLKQGDSHTIEGSTHSDFVTTLVVSDGNKRTAIDTKDILFVSANPPYINICHKTKVYLYNETLKSILSKLDAGRFVRIHKSTIVNIGMVRSYKSRLNGDYDLTMADGTELRLSRNYASVFKQKFETTHRDTIE